MVNRTTQQKQRPITAPTPSISASVAAEAVPPVPDLAHSIQGIADVIFKALEAPLRAQVEACVQAIVHEATRDIHARIVAEIGRIQPINIPINLFAQTAPAAPPAPITPPAPVPPLVMPTSEVEDEPIEEAEEAEETEEVEEIEEIEEVVEVVEVVEEIYDDEKPPAAEKIRPLAEVKPSAAPQRKNLSVTIVGLKPGQAHMIKSEFRLLKLHFIPSDAGAGPQLKSLAKTNDYVVQMTDFIRHSVTDSVKAANSNGNWIYVSGGMTTLREKLQELTKGHLTPA